MLLPVEPEVFFRDYWEKKPLLISRNDPDYYRGLPSLRDVDAMIAFSRPKFVEPGDFKPNGPVNHPFVQGWLADDEPMPNVLYPTVAEVQQAFLRGKTVILTPRSTAGRPRPPCAATWRTSSAAPSTPTCT